MTHITIPNRPFATEPITGFMIPDGNFEISFGRQDINAQVQNAGSSPMTASVYVESTSSPAISVSPRTHVISGLASGSSRQLAWEADFSAASPGAHYVSFVAEDGTERTRIIKKIFVTRTGYDLSTGNFHLETSEGIIEVDFKNFIKPRDCCCRQPTSGDEIEQVEGRVDIIDFLREFDRHDPDFELCPPGYLPEEMEAVIRPKPPFEGQYGDLPFQDYWWKVALVVIAAALFIGAMVYESRRGSGGGSITAGTSSRRCCWISASGGGSSYVGAGLTAGAAAAATLAAYTDERDPFRRGQDNTEPEEGEVTTSERLSATIDYVEPVALGRPFAVHTDWTYTRETTGGTYTHSVSETNTNQHTLSRYEIRGQDVVRTYRQDQFVVEAEFFDVDGDQVTGDELFVQCILAGPNGEYERFLLQDDGIDPDEEPNDGVYTGRFDFRRRDLPTGVWKYYVIAQDVNDATPDMDPEEMAQIIGGMVLTDQLEITFDPTEECRFVADGHVNVT